jgi:arginase
VEETKLHLLGFVFGLGGVDPHSGSGPLVLQQSSYLEELTKKGLMYEWDAMIQPTHSKTVFRKDELVKEVCLDLAKKIFLLAKERQLFAVIGGDHTSAIGTWSGVHEALHAEGDIGLIWVDAHMDSHTPETTESGRIHGMPLACLMGYGYPTLTRILNTYPKLKPENICLIGVRSFEQGEAALLNQLNVRTYFMDEVKERGCVTVLREAATMMNQKTIAYGISLDLDGIDPHDAPGVSVPEADGIRSNEFCDALLQVASDAKLVGMEIVEFNPSRDKDHATEKLIVKLLGILTQAKCHDKT